ncbi:MAG: FMN-binding protein [Actinomycetales bacterium]|nr:FMN-binding protein [Actinomycetales bacterium]
MRRIVLWALSTITTLVLLFSYHTSTSSTVSASTHVAAGAKGSGSTGTVPGTGTQPKAPGSSGSSGSAGSSGNGGSAGTGGSAGSASGTAIAGSAVPTRFGNVQVQITVADGKITGASVLQIPNRDRHDIQINNRAVPILNQEVVAAQSADIDMVSGATVTSVAYIQSLQSAIDRANL